MTTLLAIDPSAEREVPSFPETRFWPKVDKRSSDECWLWTAARDTAGYGQFNVRGKHIRAHRFAYELLVGPIPEKRVIDHLCRNRDCVNPAHLEPVTNRENILRGVSKPAIYASRTHCSQGHLYSNDNTYFRPDGGRKCRACEHLRHSNPKTCNICGKELWASSIAKHLRTIHG